MRPRRIRLGELAVMLRVRKARQALQCGHGEFAVENNIVKWRTEYQGLPSMRPRRIRRGEPRGIAARRPRSCTFNAATANSPGRAWGQGEGVVSLAGPSMQPRRIRRGEPGPTS